MMERVPAQPDEIPRITFFIDTLAQAADHRRKGLLREVQGPRESKENDVCEWTLNYVALTGSHRKQVGD